MSRSRSIPILVLIALGITSCNLVLPATPAALPTGGAASQTAPVASATQAVANTPVPPATLPAATATALPSTTPLPTATFTLPPVPTPGASAYIDDRSTPSQVIVSFYNAIDRQEYSRAYSYYSDPTNTLGAFTGFANGYQDTASVDLVFGAITGDAGMSQVHYVIPVVLKATKKNGTHANFGACYVVHEANPDVYGAPPIFPMSIDSGSAAPTSLNASDSSVLATACSGQPVNGLPSFPASANNLNIDKSNFVDNRSGPIETISSLLNSLNLKQYVRAYSYYQDPSTYPGPFDPYAAGYANTGTITVTFGTFTSEGAAGSLYYKVPLAEKVLTTASTKQTFVGCYTLRLGQPAYQTTPPFQPLGITAGKFTQVPNGSNVAALLPTACN